MNRLNGRSRTGGLGQSLQELDHGPSPLDIRDVPIDIRERYIRSRYDGIDGTGTGTGTGNAPIGRDDLAGLIRDVHAIAGTLVLNRGLIGRVVTVTNAPQLIINQSEAEGRGYLLLNPAGVVGLTAKGTLLASTALVGATTLQTGSIGVANYDTVRLFFNVTFSAGAGPVTFDIQTLDPVTESTWFTSQTVAFTATGTTYADIGKMGVDTDLAVTITVPAGTSITTAIGFVTKGGLEGTSAGVVQTIFIGSSGVSSVSGYPILTGKEKAFYLMENVQLYAVTAGPSLSLNIFEL